MEIQGALRELLREEMRLSRQLVKVRGAIDALEGRGKYQKTGRTTRRPMSPSARRRIAAAQKRRWAKVRAEKQG
jgi:hypothetical protein